MLATQLPDDHHRIGAVLVAVVAGVSGSVAKMCFDAMVQTQVHDDDRARMFARFETAFQATWVAAALLPVLIDIALRVGFAIIAVVLIVLGTRLALSTWFTPAGRSVGRRGRFSGR